MKHCGVGTAACGLLWAWHTRGTLRSSAGHRAACRYDVREKGEGHAVRTRAAAAALQRSAVLTSMRTSLVWSSSGTVARPTSLTTPPVLVLHAGRWLHCPQCPQCRADRPTDPQSQC